MKRFGHLIHDAVIDGYWMPIFLGKDGSALSHLFFADDLVFFGEATVENAGVMKGIINEFRKYSGHKVNKGKSKLFFSNNTDGDIRTSIGNLLGF